MDTFQSIARVKRHIKQKNKVGTNLLTPNQSKPRLLFLTKKKKGLQCAYSSIHTVYQYQPNNVVLQVTTQKTPQKAETKTSHHHHSTQYITTNESRHSTEWQLCDMRLDENMHARVTAVGNCSSFHKLIYENIIPNIQSSPAEIAYIIYTAYIKHCNTCLSAQTTVTAPLNNDSFYDRQNTKTSAPRCSSSDLLSARRRVNGGLVAAIYCMGESPETHHHKHVQVTFQPKIKILNYIYLY